MALTLPAALVTEYQTNLAAALSATPKPTSVVGSPFEDSYDEGRKKAVVQGMLEARFAAAASNPTLALLKEITLLNHVVIFRLYP